MRGSIMGTWWPLSGKVGLPTEIAGFLDCPRISFVDFQLMIGGARGYQPMSNGRFGQC